MILINLLPHREEKRKRRKAAYFTGLALGAVAGLLVAIPSMFGYNWLVHNLRVQTVELDNFAQELTSKMETEYLKDDEEIFRSERLASE